jgi:succinoglycan biosynthesis transport protein ExoP
MASHSGTYESPLHQDSQEHQRQRARRRAFMLTFAAVAIAGTLYTAMQPRLFKSVATVLMSAPAAIDDTALEADVQGVAIQRRILLGSDITQRLSERIDSEFGIAIEAPVLREQLSVDAVPETNLLELAATGSNRAQLPTLTRAWIAEYTDIRAREIKTRKAQTLSEVQDELAGLEQKLIQARAALDSFRSENEIISLERQGNAVLARLDGLNEALSTAVEEEVRARAYLDSLHQSLAAGAPALSASGLAEAQALAQQLEALRVRESELRAQYTEDYIRKDPRLRDIPTQVKELEERLASYYDERSRQDVAEAERDYATAQKSVAELERRLEAHKQEAYRFNTVYEQHRALIADLERLEQLNREAQARLVQVEVNNVEKYPQIAVIDWPAPQALRVGPNYPALLGGTFAGALLAGIFASWLYGYLHPRNVAPGYVTLSGVHMYPSDREALTRMADEVKALDKDTGPRLVKHQDDDEADS